MHRKFGKPRNVRFSLYEDYVHGYERISEVPRVKGHTSDVSIATIYAFGMYRVPSPFFPGHWPSPTCEKHWNFDERPTVFLILTQNLQIINCFDHQPVTMNTPGQVLLAPSPDSFAKYDFMYYIKGAAAGGICCSVTHGALTPVDVVKTRVQLDPAKVGGIRRMLWIKFDRGLVMTNP